MLGAWVHPAVSSMRDTIVATLPARIDKLSVTVVNNSGKVEQIDGLWR